MKPVIPGQLYSDQTCTDADRQKHHDEVDKKCKQEIAKVQVPKKVCGPGEKNRANKVKRLCDGLAKRKTAFEACLKAGQKMQDECFASPKNTQDEKDRQKAHEDEYARLHGGYSETLADQQKHS